MNSIGIKESGHGTRDVDLYIDSRCDWCGYTVVIDVRLQMYFEKFLIELSWR